MANEFVIKNGFISQGNSLVIGNLSATTISATTYQNLPVDPNTYITGFTYNNNTFTLNDSSGSTFNATINSVTGFTINGNLNVTGTTNLTGGLTANTISATTYQNLPIDPNTYITGFTYSSNTFTINDNSGNTFNATINTVTGWTVNGDLTVTGNTSVQSFSATTYYGLPVQYGSFGIVVDGSGSVITSGNKGYLTLPYSGTIISWRMMSDTTGSTSVDVWKTNFAGFPPTSGDSITGGNYPNLTSQQINDSSSLSGWTTTFSSGDIIAFNVLSASTVTRINLTINLTKT